MRSALALFSLLTLAACRSPGDEADSAFGWERMIDQRRYDAFEATGLFPDGTVMRTPPEGTLPHERDRLDPEVRTGRGPAADTLRTTPAAWIERIPLALDVADVRRGRNRFDIYCAVCHGIDGSGVSRVATNMSLRPPPALVEGAVRDYPAGRIFAAITEGYGLMPSYAAELAVRDRWRVVAYVRALQLARRASLDSLSADVRARVRRALPDSARAGQGSGQ